MKLAITHTLILPLGTASRAVEHLLLTPSATPQQRIERWSIEMPGFAECASFRDGFGNRAHLVSQQRPEPDLTIKVVGLVETSDRAGVIGKLDYDTPPALYRRLMPGEAAPETLIEGLADRLDRIAVLHELMERVHATSYSVSDDGEDVPSNDSQIPVQSSGSPAEPPEVVSDGLVTFIRSARSLGIPARHVTGYLFDAEASRRHEWAEAWDDGLGWIGFDPRLNLCPVDAHVRLAAGLDRTGTVLVRAVPVLAEEPAETLTISAV